MFLVYGKVKYFDFENGKSTVFRKHTHAREFKKGVLNLTKYLLRHC